MACQVWINPKHAFNVIAKAEYAHMRNKMFSMKTITFARHL